SHGMKQKLALISAFIHDPKLIILDEPFVGLDPKASFLVKEKLKQLCSTGCSVFFSSHVLEVVENLCNQIAIISNGTIMQNGPTESILSSGKTLEELFLEMESK
ncbi:MAG: ABC transporter ATP-binding protein, partial [Solobacterium sp.]|nr:ABC transporter ATP-binding protein [Solobacterium sp.]